jgi:3-hydroxyacyl-[acyl-carrier-protein] dehydratase
MRFHLIDQITGVTPGKSLQAVKNLTLGEEYLADHFPTFPVMPGVLMLEALVQAAAWLLRVSDDFKHSVIALREAKGIKYGNFLEPGKQLLLNVELSGEAGQDTKILTFKGSGETGGVATVSGRFTVARYNLADDNPALAPLDEQLRNHYRGLWLALQPRGHGSTAGGQS